MPKTIVITGTSTGMGRVTVAKFAAEGWNVVATVRKESDLDAHADMRSVKTLLLDVDDEAASVPFAERALEQFGGVDGLVNNAGYYQMGPLEGTSMEQVHRQYQTNVFSVAALIKAFLPAFRAQRSGVIVNIASLTAEQGYPYNSVYASSKAAVAAVLGCPSDLWKALMAKPGSTPVDMEV
jgi:NAD(P)-dependent dehydrogenase (short-subunit alcohol dehydrogenase family)